MARWKRMSREYEALSRPAVVNAIARKGEQGIRAETGRAADNFMQSVQSDYRSVSGSESVQKLAQDAADGMLRIDTGLVFKRRKVVKGTDIMTQLVTPTAMWSAKAIEFGWGNFPAAAVMRKAVVKAGGNLKAYKGSSKWTGS